jgi:hypothetical protein
LSQETTSDTFSDSLTSRLKVLSKEEFTDRQI